MPLAWATMAWPRVEQDEPISSSAVTAPAVAMTRPADQVQVGKCHAPEETHQRRGSPGTPALAPTGTPNQRQRKGSPHDSHYCTVILNGEQSRSTRAAGTRPGRPGTGRAGSVSGVTAPAAGRAGHPAPRYRRYSVYAQLPRHGRGRPDLRRRVPGAQPLGGGVAAGRGPRPPRRHGTTIPLVVGEHDRGRRPADGGDRRPPRRHRHHPAGHPGRHGRRGHRLGQAAARRVRHAGRARPTDTVSDALALLPKRAHGAVVVVEEAGRSASSPRPTAPAWTGSPSARVMSARPAHPARRRRPAGRVRRLAEGHHRVAPGGGRRRRWSASSPVPARCAPPSTARRWTPRAGCGSAPPSASPATWRPGRASCSPPAPTCSWSTPRTATRSGCSTRCAPCAALRPGGAGGGRQRGHRRGRARPGRGRRRHRQGRGRAGRDVHHPDDDRRRPAAVLRGAGVRGRGPASSARTCGPTAASATRATWRSRSPPAPPT